MAPLPAQEHVESAGDEGIQILSDMGALDGSAVRGHDLEQQTAQGIPAVQQPRDRPCRRLSGAPPVCRQLAQATCMSLAPSQAYKALWCKCCICDQFISMLQGC